jgi:hypothetical protein
MIEEEAHFIPAAWIPKGPRRALLKFFPRIGDAHFAKIIANGAVAHPIP